jgi:hypothetical protein
MAYKRYSRKNGKVYGPYYYESYREGNTVKKLYIGQKNLRESLGTKTPFVPQPKSPFFALSIIALVLVVVFLGFMYTQTRATGKVVLETQANYALNEHLGGQATISIQQGESIQKDT